MEGIMDTDMLCPFCYGQEFEEEVIGGPDDLEDSFYLVYRCSECGLVYDTWNETWIQEEDEMNREETEA
jgi:uncharacterized Zn finger protein